MIRNNKLSAIICALPLFLAIFLINIELTAVNLALTQIAKSFSIPINETSNILSLYLAFFAVFTMIGGKLGDLKGKKNFTIWMLGIFVIASMLGGCADRYSELLISRSLQGLSAGALLPNLTAILYNNTSQLKKRYMIGIISSIVGFSTASGPLIGSFIISYLNWRYIFFLNIPIGLMIMIGIAFVVKDKDIRTDVSYKIDYKGMFLTIALILLLMRTIDLLPSLNTRVVLINLFIFAVLFYYWYRRHVNFSNPFLSLSFFKKNTYLTGCIIRMLLGFSYYIILYVLGVFAQVVLHFKLSLSGFIYLPLTLSVTLASLFYGRISDNINLAVLLRVGLAIFLLGILLFLSFLHSISLILIALIIIGCSYGILYSTLFSITLHDIHETNTSEASGSLYFFNLLGGTLGVSLTGAVFAFSKNLSLEQTLLSGVHSMFITCVIIIVICLVFSFVTLRRLT